jgi:ketosteroid isomerase-like protein
MHMPVTDQALQKAVHEWSRACGQKDVATYLSMYANDFVAPNGISRPAWAQLRTQRIQSKKHIRHEVQGLQVSMGQGRATFRFEQLYADELLRRIDQKTLHWVLQDGQLRITRETTH